MRIHRFYFSFTQEKEQLCEDALIVNQVRNVLRLREGDEIVFTNGQGKDIQVKITFFGKEHFDFSVVSEIVNVVQNHREVVLYCSILKRDNFEWVVQKSVELGVSQIVPVITDRTIKKQVNLSRLQKISIEAMEQSGRSFLPEVLDAMKLESAIKHAREFCDQQVFLHFDQQDVSDMKKDQGSIGIFVGPEGGWSDDEIDFVREFHVDMYSLGSAVLRAETAAVVSVYEFGK